VRTLLLAALAAAVAVPAALAGPKDPTKRHTAADTRIAKAVALRLSDFRPGWKQEKADNSSGPDCSLQPDQSKLIETADVDPTFDSPNGGVVVIDSEVTLYRTSAMALADWKSAPLPVLRACFAEFLKTQSGAKTTVSASRVHVAANAERTVGYHFELGVKGNVLALDLIALQRGRTEVFLSAFGPKGSYSRSLLDPLARLLAARLAAHA
jgi:hypothetical protein